MRIVCRSRTIRRLHRWLITMRNHASPAQMERARKVLTHECRFCSRSDDWATAAERVYDKLQAQLAPLLGVAGFEALLVRSAKLTQSDFVCLREAGILESSAKLRAGLCAHESAVVAEAATALFGTFFALVTTFIGERLTTEVLRGVWPSIEATPPKETEK